MKIVVLDSYTLSPSPAGWDPLKQFASVEIYPRVAESDVPVLATGADILITNKVNISAAVMEKNPTLKYIGVSATGFNCVDTSAARNRKIPVTNVPEYGTASVAQFTIALLLELCHRIGLHADAVHAGEWTRSKDFCFWKTPQVELVGKTMGIVGMGRIGGSVAALAAAFGMKIVFYSPSGMKHLPKNSPFSSVSLEVLLETSDVVSLHCPLVQTTQGLMNTERLGTMKPSAFLINTSRGGLMVESDLADALKSGRIAGAAVDVVSREPIAPDNPLLGAKNCIVTPHIAWTTTEARRRLLQTTIDNVKNFLAGQPTNIVNG